MTSLLMLVLVTGSFQEITFSNWRFQLTPAWIQSNQGENLVLAPYERARARESRCVFRPGFAANQPLDRWFDAEWTSLVAGRTPTTISSQRHTVYPRGVPGLERWASFKDSSGPTSHLWLIAFNPPGSINEIIYTAENDDSYSVSAGILGNLLQTIRFEGAPTAQPPVTPKVKQPSNPPPSNAKPPVTEPPANKEPTAVGSNPPKATPTSGLGSPDPFGPDPGEQVDWDGPDVMVRSTSDLNTVKYSTQKMEMTLAAAGLHSSVQPRDLTYEQAIANVAALFSKPEQRKVLQTMRTDAQHFGSAGRLQAAAFRGALAGDTGYTLACLFVHLEKAPGDPTVMFNLAGALAQCGYPNESLALLQKLQSLGKWPLIAFGYDPQACVAYVRGYDQMLIGQLIEARTSLRSAVAKDSSLTDAQYTLALVEAVLGQECRKPLLTGVWRVNHKPMYCGRSYESDPFVEEKPDNVAMPIDAIFDLSAGVDRSLPSLSHPTSGEAALRMKEIMFGPEGGPMTGGELGAILESIKSLAKQASDLYKRLIERKFTVQDRVDSKICDIIEPPLARLIAVQELRKQKHDRHEELAEAGRRIFAHADKQIDEFMEWWRANLRIPEEVVIARKKALFREIISNNLGQIRPFAQAYDLACRRHFKAWYRYATGLAAVITDPEWKRYADLRIQSNALGEWMDAYGIISVYFGASVATISRELYEPDEAMQKPSRPEVDKLKECNGGGKNHTLEYKLNDDLLGGMNKVSLTAKLSCDKVALDVTGNVVEMPGLSLGMFGEVSRNSKGELTVFLGPKGSVDAAGIFKVGDATANLGKTSVTVKDGIYIKVSKSGVKDIGMKVDFSAGVTRGPAKFSEKLDSMEFSFLPTPPTPPKSFGLQIYKNR